MTVRERLTAIGSSSIHNEDEVRVVQSKARRGLPGRPGGWWFLTAVLALAAALSVAVLGTFWTKGAPVVGAAPRTGDIAGVTLVSSTTNCATGGFCIQGAVSGVGPTAGRTLGLTLINPNLYPIFVTSVTVKANDTSGCPGSATIASPGWSSKDTSPIPTDSIPVPPASSFGPGQATTSVTVSWTDSKTTNQTGCLGVSVPLTYGGRALWYGSCITRQQSGLSIAPGAVACVGAGGKISGGVTVPSGAGLVLDPGAVVSGGVNATGGATEIMFCSASVSGGVTVSKATGPVVIGNGSYCGGNTISGGLTVTHNTGGVTTLGNSVSGPTNVSNNSGSVPAP